VASPYSQSNTVCPGDPDPLVDKRDVARHVKKSVRSVERLMYSGRIPYIRVGGVVRFRLNDVDRALSCFEVKAVTR
jgi:excisionase family DNA binding protein